VCLSAERFCGALVLAVAPRFLRGGSGTEISNFRYHHPARGLFRGTLKVRISGQMLLDLAVKLFRTAR